jgi:murein L,D-transpeptidase YafK
VLADRAPAQGAEPPWTEVDTAARTLTVYAADGRRLARYGNISVGSGGVAAVHYRGDHTTPLGNFRIVQIRPSRSFDTFYLLDYPTAEDAAEALGGGRLTAEGHEAIAAAAREGRLPPQDTALGGAIGIHGIGRGSPKIHRMYNWTDGCVALTNEQLRDFARHAVVGMRVIIR